MMTMRNNAKRKQRGGFTLLELMLSLALIVVATVLIGSLMQLYARNFATRGDDIRRQQLARSILTMIADDIRAVVVEQEYDPSVLEQLFGASSQGGGGAEETDASGGLSGLASDSGMDSELGLEGYGDEGSMTDDLSMMATSSLPPGIYGSQTQLMVDVSRVPRPDEYIIEQTSMVDGTVNDVPGDLKMVTYYIQTETNQGVEDAMAVFNTTAGSGGFASGLVRRQLDRNVTAYSEEMGDTSRLLRTGDLLAPEVIALEFSYFDGTQWLTTWDSSTQSLPWLVQISLAMQSASGEETADLPSGTPLSTLTFDDRTTYGIEVYELTVAIPGAQLRASDVASEEEAMGMEAMGL